MKQRRQQMLTIHIMSHLYKKEPPPTNQRSFETSNIEFYFRDILFRLAQSHSICKPHPAPALLDLLVEIFGHWVVGEQDLYVIGARVAELVLLVGFLQVLSQTGESCRDLKLTIFSTHNLRRESK